MHFFGQFKDHNPGRKHGNWTVDPIFFIYIFYSVCNIHSFFENSQNSFSCSLSFGPFRYVKYFNFGRQKLPVGTAYQTFLESRHIEVTKNPYYILPHKGALKKYQPLMSHRFFLYA